MNSFIHKYLLWWWRYHRIVVRIPEIIRFKVKWSACWFIRESSKKVKRLFKLTMGDPRVITRFTNPQRFTGVPSTEAFTTTAIGTALESLQKSITFQDWVMTCTYRRQLIASLHLCILRILHNNNAYSEEVDFFLTRTDENYIPWYNSY